MNFYVIFGDLDVIFGDFLVGTGEPPRYCNKIPTKSPFCMVVVLVWKSWDWVRSPPPSLGQKPNFGQFFFNASLTLPSSHFPCCTTVPGLKIVLYGNWPALWCSPKFPSWESRKAAESYEAKVQFMVWDSETPETPGLPRLWDSQDFETPKTLTLRDSQTLFVYLASISVFHFIVTRTCFRR